MQAPLLDLDKSKNISDLGIYINTTYLPDTIYKLIEIVKNYGKFSNQFNKDFSEIFQYVLNFRYLAKLITVYFEFDNTHQYINVFIYNATTEKYCLKIFLCISEGPSIKYIENDKSGYISSYSDDRVNFKPGGYLMNFAHRFLNHIGYQGNRLDDDSYLIIQGSNETEIKVKLWLYYLLTKEKSWYAKFGYVPANCSDHEYVMKIRDVQNIKLNEVSQLLNLVVNSTNKYYIDKTIIETSERIIGIIGESTETLLEYTKSHNIFDFAKLVNNLFQSIYSKKILIKIAKSNSLKIKSDSDSDSESMKDCETRSINFSWYDKYMSLFVANVCQVNNDISKWYHTL